MIVMNGKLEGNGKNRYSACTNQKTCLENRRTYTMGEEESRRKHV